MMDIELLLLVVLTTQWHKISNYLSFMKIYKLCDKLQQLIENWGFLVFFSLFFSRSSAVNYSQSFLNFSDDTIFILPEVGDILTYSTQTHKFICDYNYASECPSKAQGTIFARSN